MGETRALDRKNSNMDNEYIDERRNHHVKKLLVHLGGQDVAPYLQRAIKRSFSEFAEDIKGGQNGRREEINGNR